MSHFSVRGEQSTSSEITALTNLAALAASGAGEFIRKTGLTTFENATPGSSGFATTALDNLAAVAINAALVLGTSDAFALGSATKMWADLFLASGAVINFNNGNATITHSAGLLTSNVDIVVPAEVYGAGWNGSNEVPTKNDVYDKIEAIIAAAGATVALDNLSGVAINAALVLATSDAFALGSATKMWADLFLASGAVINFNNGNVTLTHSAGVLTLGGTATLALGANSLTLTGSIAATGARVTKGWFTDLETTNMLTVNGTALTASALTWSALQTYSLAGVTNRMVNTTDNASVQVAKFEGDRATMANNDEGYISFFLSDSAGTQTEFGRFTWRATTVTDASEAGRLALSVMTAGTLAEEVYLTGTAFSPAASDGNALGTTALMWADLFLASGGVINFNNGNMTMTHAAGSITFAGGNVLGLGAATATTLNGNTFTTGSYTLTGQAGKTLTFNGTITLTGTDSQTYTFPTTSATLARIDAANTFVGASTASAWVLTSPTITTKISPTSDDGAPLGDTTHNFSDLFLASGAVINYANGDVTITHSSNLLAFASSTGGYTFDNLLIVGGTASLTTGGTARNVQIQGTTAATAGLSLLAHSATAGVSADITFYRSKNASIGSATVVASGDSLGSITWTGAQQTGTFATQNNAAQIRAEVDGTVTSGAGADMPGRLIFSTTPDGSGTLTDRLILDSSGALKPNTNDGLALGNTTNQFSDLFLAEGGVINWDNGDATLTQSGNTLTIAGAELIIEDASTYPTSTVSAGFRGIPQNSKSAAYTTVMSDAGKHILHPTADNNARTFTIDSNANVAYPIGTAITFINQINTVTIAITSDTLTLAGTGGTGSRTLAANGIATAVKVSSTGWVISGTGLT